MNFEGNKATSSYSKSAASISFKSIGIGKFDSQYLPIQTIRWPISKTLPGPKKTKCYRGQQLPLSLRQMNRLVTYIMYLLNKTISHYA